jgi:hypothetical protein
MIPFRPAFKEALLNGVKTCTARTSRKGKPGDLFTAFGVTFQLRSVERVPLHVVADFWYQEGCRDREHFLEVWKEIHPGVGYRPKQLVYLHQFTKVISP